jgi:hypothetical protein
MKFREKPSLWSIGAPRLLRTAELNRSIPGSLRRVAWSLVVVTLWVCIGAPAARAQSEDQVKAAFLFNFARYVEWPEASFDGPGDALRICMVGGDRFAEVVSRIVSGKRVANRPVSVDSLAGLSGAAACHILYVDERFSVDAQEVAARLGGSSVFTVSDRTGFAAGGGIANFIRSENKIRFEINPSAAKQAGLKVSSQLLRLAKLVE